MTARLESLGRAAWRRLVRPPGLDDLAWRARLARYAQAQSYADWDQRSLFLTLTFREKLPNALADKAWSAFLRVTAATVVKGHFRFARVMDAQSDGRSHIHTIMEGIAIEDPRVWPFQQTVRVEDVLAVWEGLPGWTCASRHHNHAEYYVEGARIGLDGQPRDACFGYMFLRHGGDQLGIACPRSACCRRERGCVHGRMEVGR
jgi:hypothetical protein